MNRFAMLLALALALGGNPTSAQVYINELFFDPGSSGSDLDDRRDEFIELRGPAGMSLDDHYLIFVESEDNSSNTGPAGLIDNIFDLNDLSLGDNGYLVFRQSGGGDGASRYTAVPGATDLINTGSGPGYGSGPTSSIGASDVGDEGVIENGAFSALLIHIGEGPEPVLNEDLDLGNDGLDHPSGREGWTVLDSVSAFEPFEAIFGQAYGQTVFGTEEIGELAFFEGGIVAADPGLEPGAEYFGTGWEIEYVGRWGNSTGSAVADWHASNLTLASGAGSQDPIDLRQSFTGDHGDLGSGSTSVPPAQPGFSDGEIESSQGVPYGTQWILDQIGGPNFILGDYNGDGYVNAADYTVWRDSEGDTATELAMQPADHNHDFVVNDDDYDFWATRYGGPNGAAPATPASLVPEPSSLAATCLTLALFGSRRRKG